MKSTTAKDRPPLQIGWRETVGLIDLGVPEIHAKIDTGARTSALHATHITPFQKDGEEWVRFRLPRAGTVKARTCEAPLVDQRKIKNTSGVPEERYVISTTLILGRRHWKIEVSLADRANMKSPIILGRSAIRRHRILVNAGKSFLAGRPVIGGSSKLKTTQGTSDAAFLKHHA